MKQYLKILFLSFVTTGIFACSSSNNKNSDQECKTEIMVYSAASLTDVLIEIIDSFEVTYPIKVKTNMASSGTLARQIEQGGDPDVYLSASKKWADYVDTLGAFITGTRANLAKNELVLIAPIDSKLKEISIDSSINMVKLLAGGRLSMGDPAHVPAGKYAKQSLSYFGWFNKLSEKLLPSKDVRSALMVVERGEAPLGIVYRTDAQKSESVKVLSAFSESSHKPITYVGAACKDNEAAKTFIAYLNDHATLEIWSKYGFKK